MTTHAAHERILTVANRLPVTIRNTGSGMQFQPSSGGLATGLRSLSPALDMVWVGWPGAVRVEDKKGAESRLVRDFGCHPVFMAQELVQKYYDGYANKTIWPIFHSSPSFAKFVAAEWEAYKKANALFARKVLEVYRPGDTIWIHDYHLLLLANALREHLPNATMGFFLHIPFPHYDIFRLLPQHREILDSLLSLDMIGVHTHDYAQALLGCARRIRGLDNTLGQLLVGDRVVQVDVFPMGIDFRTYADATADPEIRSEVETIRTSLSARKAVFSVSRLDYTKGIPESMEAIEQFFRANPEWVERVVFVLVVVPSREGVERYAALKREIDETVGRINSAFGTLEWQPIRYIYRSLTFGELIGLYANAEVGLVTPLRDGMNLVSKEFLATKADNRGVLILSEMAGAAKELQEAILVNPNSTEEIVAALLRALTMPEEDQTKANAVMRQRLETHDIHHWVKRYFDRLDEVKSFADALAVRMLQNEARQQLVDEFTRAERRLLLLDYDGTIVPFAPTPDGARPDAKVLSTLSKLSACPHTQVVILSGRDRGTLDEWLGGRQLTLVAEHGGWVQDPGHEEWTSTLPTTENAWKKEIEPILSLFVDRIPGSFVEEKTFSLVWHYRQAEETSAAAAARELMDHISALTTNLNIQVVPGSMAVEVRHAGINKGIYYSRFLVASAPPFILAMGDDWTDEDLFAVLPPHAYSIKVAPRMSKARWNLRSYHDARALLEKLASYAGVLQRAGAVGES